MHWVRYDAHTCDHIKAWPINWTELWRKIQLPLGSEGILEEHIDISRPHDMGVLSALMPNTPTIAAFDQANYLGWHSIEVSAKTVEEFRIDVGYHAGPWPVPKPYYSPLMGPLSYLSIPWKLYFLVTALSTLMDQFRDGHSEAGFLGDNPKKPNCSYPLCCIIKTDGQYQGFALQSCMGAIHVNWIDIDPTQSQPSWLCRITDILVRVINRIRVWVCEKLRVRTCRGEHCRAHALSGLALDHRDRLPLADSSQERPREDQ